VVETQFASSQASRAAEAGRRDARRTTPVPTTIQAAAVAGVVLVAYAVIELTWPNDGAVKRLTVLIFPLMSLIYVPLAALAAAKAQGRLRTAWCAVTVGLASWALGEVSYAYYTLAVGRVPFPSLADAAYLFFVPCVAVALLLFSSVRRWRNPGRMVLDGLIVTGSFFLISWLGVMRAVWHSDAVDRLHFVVSLAYPLGDVLVVTLCFVVLLKAPPGLRTALALLVAGLVCAAVADSLWVFQSKADGEPAGPVPDVLYVANALLIIVALVAAYHADCDSVPAAASPGLLALWLPIVPLMAAAVLVATSQPSVVREPPVVIIGVMLIVATVMRQFAESVELVRRERQNRQLADVLSEELDSASHYVASILPGPLLGPVQVSSRYLPARAVGGDSFGYQWIDDDHLIVYLVDVSGHGVRPALLSVSMHNLLRSGGLAAETLLEPARVMAELNSGFSMEDHDGHYFTMWYGVYQLSTGMLRYVNAGHPPPLVLTGEGDTVGCVPLIGGSMPGGMFSGSEFSAESYLVPAGARLLLYSDGVLGDPPRMAEFIGLCTHLATGPSFWLDDLIDEVPGSEDDSSLVLLTFPAAPVAAAGVAPASAASTALRR
jgi:hypothetical protein